MRELRPQSLPQLRRRLLRPSSSENKKEGMEVVHSLFFCVPPDIDQKGFELKSTVERIYDFLCEHSGEMISLEEMQHELDLTFSQAKAGIGNFRNSKWSHEGVLIKGENNGEYCFTLKKGKRVAKQEEELEEEISGDYDPMHAFFEGQSTITAKIEHIGHNDEGYCIFKMTDEEGEEHIFTSSTL